MPSFVSKIGKWEAAHERVAYTDKNGEPQIYDGPDRAAEEFIKQEGGSVGQDALKDPQLMQAARNSGFNDVPSYLAAFQPSEKEIKEVELAQKAVVTHNPPKAKKGVSGGTKGGFYDDEKSNPYKELDKKG